MTKNVFNNKNVMVNDKAFIEDSSLILFLITRLLKNIFKQETLASIILFIT